MRPASRVAIAGWLVAALLGAESALANGRYPASGQISLDPSTEKVLLVRATYGLMFSTNAGQSWGWICESAVGYGGEEDPMMAFTANGTLLAGIFEGLSIGSTDACSWQFAGGGLASRFVVDLSVDKVTPANAVLLVSNSNGQNDAGTPVFLTQLWQTSDNGATWAQAGVTLDPLFLGLTVDTAPSNPMRVYASGRFQPPDYAGVIQRSDDRGATWSELPIPGTDMNHLAYIGGVDPKNPDIVYVRIDSDSGDSLLVSKDGAMTWTTLLQVPGKLNGFAISPDGSTIATGSAGVAVDAGETQGAGIWTAPSSTLALTRVSPVGALCLTWGATGLFACADEFTDGFTAGVSTNEGKSFTPLLHLGGLCGPLACGASTEVGSQCPAQWPATQLTIGASCPSADGGAGGSSAGSTVASSSSGGATTPAASKSGCSCALPRETTGGAMIVSLVGLGAGLSRLRRSRARAATRARGRSRSNQSTRTPSS